jgi:hypothetical protein
MKKFFKTIITIEVLSEYKYNNTNLLEINYDIDSGDCSGKVEVTKYEELTPEQMAKAALAQGSDPEFFGLTNEGLPIDQDDIVTLERGESIPGEM